MRTFIVSDLHGCGNVYKSITDYLDNIHLVDGEDIELYINGDLIDRGHDSLEMLLDVKSRIEGKGNVKINYLAGNHELLFCDAMKDYSNSIFFSDDPWLMSGGRVTLKSIELCLNNSILDWDDINELIDFLLNLDVYKVFPKAFCGKSILLVHACAPDEVHEECHLKLRDIDESSINVLEYRGENVGKNGFLTIVGHTPGNNKYGFSFFPKGQYLNIDGGCAEYALSPRLEAHVPLVEVKKEGYLEILTFNANNEITHGFYFSGNICPMDEDLLNERRRYINLSKKH